MLVHFVSFSVGVLMDDDDTASLRVFRAGFVPPLVDSTVTVTRLDKATTDLLQQGKDFQQSDLYDYEDDDYDDDDSDTDDDDDDDDDNSRIFVAQQTTADKNCLFHSVSFALTGKSIP